MNYALLKGKMAENGLTQKKLATEIGMTVQALNVKLKQNKPFKISQISMIMNCLNLEKDDIIEIFF